MGYKAYIDAKINVGSGLKWMMVEALPTSGTYITRKEAELQARDSLKYWRRHHKAGKLRAKYEGFRSRVVKK